VNWLLSRFSGVSVKDLQRYVDWMNDNRGDATEEETKLVNEAYHALMECRIRLAMVAKALRERNEDGNDKKHRKRFRGRTS